jgi:hypothetical protein
VLNRLGECRRREGNREMGSDQYAGCATVYDDVVVCGVFSCYSGGGEVRR